MSRNYPSGASKRKKEAKELQDLVKHPKLTTYFQSQCATATQSSSSHSSQPDISTCNNDSITDTTTSENFIARVNQTQRQDDYQEVDAADASSSCTNKCDMSSNSEFPTDAALWNPITEELRSYWTRKGPNMCQNRECDFSETQRIYGTGEKLKRRCLTISCFRRELRNGETVMREWLLYSPSKKCVYCFTCRLFLSNPNAQSSTLCTTGYNDWKNVSGRLSEHENNEDHRKCSIIYTTRAKQAGLIDTHLATQIKSEQEYWRAVLHRIVSVVKFLASRSLAFRGSNQIIGSNNNGNYLGCLELISKYDPFLEEHLKKYGNAGKGNPSYLSATICDEFVSIMGKKVLLAITNELRQAKYFSLSVDSTPDVNHCDQLAFTVRYVKQRSPVERFLGFINCHGHDAENLCNVILKFLRDNDISIADCRGQSYDNASNMSGQYTGVQARIKDINKSAVYVPCAAHSLNLVGVKAVGCCLQVVAYFDFVQRLYVFFAASTHRWHVLTTCLGENGKVVKRLSDTRWSAHADAVKALCNGYQQIQTALETMANDKKLPKDVICEAASLSKKMDKLEIVILTVMWNDILSRFNQVSKSLQSPEIDLKVAVDLIHTLQLYVQELRDQFGEYERKAKERCIDSEYSELHKRVRKRSVRITFFEGPAEDTIKDVRQKFKDETYLPIIDSLNIELKKRAEAYENINSRFNFLVNLRQLDKKQIMQQSENLATFYSEDLDQQELFSECLHLQHYLSVAFEGETSITMSAIYTMLKNDALESTFPNVEVSIRMFLSMMVANCTGERSFSKLKLIKNELRSCILQERLNCLSVMSIESDVLESLDFTDIVSEFADSKARKRSM